MGRERTRGFEEFQAAHATMTDPCVYAGNEVFLDQFHVRERTMPVNFDHELESVGWRLHLRAFQKWAHVFARHIVSLEIHGPEMTD